MKREYNYYYNLKDEELPFGIKNKYQKIKYNIEKNNYYTSILEKIEKLENKSFYDYLITGNIDDGKSYKHLIVNELNKKSKEFYNITFSVEYGEEGDYYIDVLDMDNTNYGITMDVLPQGKVNFNFLN